MRNNVRMPPAPQGGTEPRERLCCGRPRFATFEAADAALRHMEFIADGHVGVHVFQCPAGWWHLKSGV